MIIQRLLITYLFFGFCLISNPAFSETTTSDVSLEEALSLDRIDDGTCKNISSKWCCHQGFPYSCSTLKRYLGAGKCRTSIQSRRWVDCSSIKVQGEKPQSAAEVVQEKAIADESNLPDIHDGTCERDDKYGPEFNCHQGHRYRNTSFLLKQFAKGLCVDKPYGRRWVKCSSIKGYDPYRVSGPDKEKSVVGKQPVSPIPLSVDKPQELIDQQQAQNEAEPTQDEEASGPSDATSSGGVLDGTTSDDVAESLPKEEEEVKEEVEEVELPRVVCTEETGLLMRDDAMNIMSSGRVNKKLKQGQKVSRVTNEVRSGGKYNYVKVTDGTNTGWVAKEFLVEKEEDCGPLNEQVVCTESGGDLFIRGLTANGAVGDSVGKLPNLTEVEIQNSGTKKRGGLDYVEVKAGNKTGWVASKLLASEKGKCESKASAGVSGCQGMISPVKGGGVLGNRRFGRYKHPIKKVYKAHTGWDYPGSRNSKTLVAVDGGRVSCGNAGGYGKMVTINHGNGLSTRYAHLASYGRYCGKTVSKGQTIGIMGTTGLSTGVHLHFEVRRNGVAVDPKKYINNSCG